MLYKVCRMLFCSSSAIRSCPCWTQDLWLKLHAAKKAQAQRAREHRQYDVALGDGDIVEPHISAQPRDFRPPAASTDIAVMAAHAKLRGLQSCWSMAAQRQWYQVT
jgi:hypothetical protein